MTPEDMLRRFSYHAPDPQRGHLHTEVREACGALADDLNQLLPEGREKSLAITHLEEVMFWSNAAIARDDK